MGAGQARHRAFRRREKKSALDSWINDFGYKLEALEQIESLSYEDYFTQQEEFFEEEAQDHSDKVHDRPVIILFL